MIRNDIGPVAAFRYVIVVEKLPKTRSGKILRGTLKKMLDGQEFTIPATIDDDSVLNDIKLKILEAGFGVTQNIIYEEDVKK